MIWLLTRSVVWPLKAGVYGVSAGYRTGRLLGFRRLTVFLLGVFVGLLVAPVPGEQMRARLRQRLMPEPVPIPLPPADRGPRPVPATVGQSTIDLTAPESSA